MNRVYYLLTVSMILLLALAACGSEEKTGVDLRAAGPGPTDTPVPSPTPAPAEEPAPASYDGRLLVQTGMSFILHDLATGESTPFTDLKAARGEDPVSAFGQTVLNLDRTRGVFVAFPNFGTLDIASGEVNELNNTGSFPNALTISPDGQWIAATTGSGMLNRLALLAFDGSVSYSVAASSRFFYQPGWTPDSQLVYWPFPTDDPPDDGAAVVPLLFDPATGESTPLEDTAQEVIQYPFFTVSPDDTRLVNVPIGNDGGDGANCFDSFVQLTDLPILTGQDNDPNPDPAYTEPRLVASSGQWLDDDTVLFVRLGQGTCGQVDGEPERMVMRLDLTNPNAVPEPVAGPLGNADDLNDEAQTQGRFYGHLYAPSPDGRYIAWVDGGRAAGETMIKITDIETGETRTVLHFAASEFADSTDYIEHGLIRQVVWLE